MKVAKLCDGARSDPMGECSAPYTGLAHCSGRPTTLARCRLPLLEGQATVPSSDGRG